MKTKASLHEQAVTKIPFPGSHTNDLNIYNTLTTCLLHITLHHKRMKWIGCPMGSTYLANIHDVGGHGDGTPLAHDKSPQQHGQTRMSEAQKTKIPCGKARACQGTYYQEASSQQAVAVGRLALLSRSGP